MSNVQHELVDDLIVQYHSLKDPKERAESLRAFLRDHPEIGPSVAVETFAFTDLKEPFMKEKLFSEYIDEILFLREHYSEAYFHVFGYLDRDIISYLCMMDKTDEIDSYLDLFRKYPGQDPDNLDAVLKFLMCQGLFDQAYQLARDVVKQLGQDPVIDEQPLQILTMGCFAPLLDAAVHGEWTDNTTRIFSEADIGAQLLVDIARYQSHPDCQALVCFIYDPEGRIGNPNGLESDLTADSLAVPVRVIVGPKGL